MTRGAASDEYQFTLAALRVAKNQLWKERHTMPFTFKLSKRLARLKPRAVILALAALVACDQADRMLTSPSDRKSTRLNSSHGYISYAVFCLKKKKRTARSLCRVMRRTQRTNCS